MTNDQDWARDLFDRARADRGGGEPAWTPDQAVIGRAGTRRRQVRTLSTGLGAVAGVAAVAVAAAMTGGTAGQSAAAVPDAAELSKVFQYFATSGGGFVNQPTDLDKKGYPVPAAAARDVAVLADRLDPAHAHLRSWATQGGAAGHLVGDTSQEARDIESLAMDGQWTPDGVFREPNEITKPTGNVSVVFYAELGPVPAQYVAAQTKEAGGLPCGYNLRETILLPYGSAPGDWSDCKWQDLLDGSKVGTSSRADGAGTVQVAIRAFPDGTAVTAAAEDFRTASPDPVPADRVIKPAPWTSEQLATALSDPTLVPGVASHAEHEASAGFLTPADLGSGWKFDPRSSSDTQTGNFPMDNGCDYKIADLAKPGDVNGYTGKAPDGQALSVLESEYPLKSGQGAPTMATARAQAQGGCDPKGSALHFSQDTRSDLPSGIGDDAFLMTDYGNSSVRVTIRFGDTIVRTDITADPAGKIPDLTSAADHDWLVKAARQIAARYTARK